MGRSVKLYLVDGTATGILTAEVGNWTGHVLASPRSRLDVALGRDELKKTGVYILYGQDNLDDLPKIYIGEGDDISQRLRAHSKDDNKDYWDKVIAISNKDLNLTKAHVKYLESELIIKARSANKSEIMNKTDPQFQKLPESDISDMNNFLDELELILPVIGVDFFRSPKRTEKNKKLEEIPPPIFTISNTKKGIDARATLIEGEFVVLSGSKGDLHSTISFLPSSSKRREHLMERDILLKIGGNSFELSEDVVFSSPSGASIFLHGTARNGRTDWLAEGTNQTYADWEIEKLDHV